MSMVLVIVLSIVIAIIRRTKSGTSFWQHKRKNKDGYDEEAHKESFGERHLLRAASNHKEVNHFLYGLTKQQHTIYSCWIPIKSDSRSDVFHGIFRHPSLLFSAAVQNHPFRPCHVP